MTVCFPIVLAIDLASNNVAHCHFVEQVIETVPMTPIEREIVAIAQRLINPLNQEIRSYCKRQLIPHNPSLQLTIDAVQATVSAVVGGGYTRHTDKDTTNCDDMCSPEEIAQLGRPKVNGVDMNVLTMVISSSTPQNDINLKVYYPGDSGTEVASLPSLGPIHAHLQYYMMQLAEHMVTNGVGDIGEGYRIVLSFRTLGPFQQNRAMVVTCCSCYRS